MKKHTYLVAMAVSAALIGFGGGGFASTIAGSKHDLTGLAGGATDDPCLYCHTLHYAAALAVPLWNRANATVGYTMYSSPTLDGTVQSAPVGVSLACLSCHDGTTALEAHSGRTGTTLMTGPAAVGSAGDLSDDHPISIAYGMDSGLAVAVAGKVGPLPLFGPDADQVECASCHDAHEAAFGKFLRMSNVNSALCKTCHLK